MSGSAPRTATAALHQESFQRAGTWTHKNPGPFGPITTENRAAIRRLLAVDHLWPHLCSANRKLSKFNIGPASGSLDGDEPYAGSRCLKQRYEYSQNSRSAFVELHRSWYPPKEEGPQEFKAWLEAVPGVERVEWQNGKASQGKVGEHYCEQNLLVYTSISGPGSASALY